MKPIPEDERLVLMLSSPAFRDFAERQALTLDDWEARTKAEISARAEHARRSLGQMARRLRISWYATHDVWPAPSDPDFLPIIQAMRNRQTAAALVSLLEGHARAGLVIPIVRTVAPPRGERE